MSRRIFIFAIVAVLAPALGCDNSSDGKPNAAFIVPSHKAGRDGKAERKQPLANGRKAKYRMPFVVVRSS